VDSHSENRPDQDPCNNNYVWIEHPNGEWTKYSHMIKNSVRRGAGLSEGLFGCAHGEHLHFQVADLGADSANARSPIDCNAASNLIACNGGLKDKGRDRVPVICNVPRNKFEEDKEYIAAGCQALLLSATEIDFGTVRPTEPEPRTLTIRNTLGVSVAVTLSDPTGDIFTWTPRSQSAPGQ
jgi:hypothetical protein